MRRVAPIAISIPLLLAACANSGSAEGGAGGDLTGVTWVLDRASMATLVGHVPADARVDIAFDGTQAHGVAACNSYGGGYQADSANGTLTFSQMASTAMGCADDVMALESAYLHALGDVTGYQVTGDQAGLQLTGGTAVLTFQPEQPAAPLPLEGTEWRLTSIAKPATQAVASTIAGTTVTLSMQAGTAGGSGGCNRYHGSYETTGEGSLSIGPLASTKMDCEQAVSVQEDTYLATLGKVASYAIEGETLTLSDASGGMLLAFSGKALR
jgi:heat shock protein HslJ